MQLQFKYKKLHSTTFTIIIILSSGKVIIIDQHDKNGYTRVILSTLYRTTCCSTFTASAITTQENLHMQPKCKEQHFFEWFFFNLTVPGSQCFYLMLNSKNTSQESFVWPNASFKKHSYNQGKVDFWKYYMERAPSCYEPNNVEKLVPNLTT